LPIDAAARSKIVGVREDLARAFALQQTSHEAGARELFARAVTVAKGTGYAPIEAEALSAQGGLFLAAREADAAIAALDDSVLAAVAGRHERAEARGWIDLVRAYALAGSWAPAHEAARHARAALERGPDELRTAALLRNEGVTSWREGKLVDAEGALERSRVLFEKLLSPDHPDVASVLLDLAGVLSAQGRTDESVAATRRALEVRERAFGAAHPLAAEARTLLAVQTRAQAGRPDPAGLAAH
jgi:tetratricopeptide (TPR) repeat protein